MNPHSINEKIYKNPPNTYFFSRVLRDSTSRFEGPLVRWSVRPSVTLYFFFWVLGFWALLLLPK